MDLGLLSPPSSSSSSILFSPFRHNPLLLKPIKVISRRTHQFKVSFSTKSDPVPSLQTESKPDPSIFLPRKDVSGPKSLFGTLPPPARIASSCIVTAAAIAAGFALGVKFGRTRVAGIGAAAVLGAAGGAAVVALNSSVPEVAAASLHNLVLEVDDPLVLRKEDVDGIVHKFGVSRQDEAFRAELSDLYSRFVSSVIPPGAENLRGNEVEMIIKFKTALGIDDPDAASAHMEIGRRIFRQRLETRDQEADLEQRRAFQKLVYVSALVFGEAAKFLLPWKRLFKVTDAQVDIAIRDNAQRLYALKLNSVDKGIKEEQLISLREAQLLYKLTDEVDMVASNLLNATSRLAIHVKISGRIGLVML